jgi:hypothetical protein
MEQRHSLAGSRRDGKVMRTALQWQVICKLFVLFLLAWSEALVAIVKEVCESVTVGEGSGDLRDSRVERRQLDAW